MSLKSMLEQSAERFSDKAAIISGERRLSYAGLNEASNRVANAFIKMGVKKGDRVAMLLTNSPECIIIYFGIIKAGAIAVPLDANYKIDELTSIFDDCLPKLLVTENATLESLIPFLSRFSSIRHLVDLNSSHQGKAISYEELVAESPAQRIEAEPEPEDIAHIGYTSGPSFGPRGVMLSHRSLVEETAISAAGFQQTDKDIVMLYALSLNHMFALVAVLFASIYKGSTVVIVPGTGLSIGSFMATMSSEKGTIFIGVPYIYALAVDLAEKEGIKNDLSSLRLCASAGAPLPVNRVKRFKQLYGYDILDCWGLTEAVCHLTCPSLNGSGKPGSIGKALPGWEVKVVDDEGRELAKEQAGELIVRGPVMKGYYNKPQATAEIMKDGWLYTGDIGKADGDGNLFITGRKKDTIIVKGQNIFPSDIEKVLYAHPKVAEVAVIGIYDQMRGEVVGAVIGLKKGEVATEQDIKRFCLERMISYKVPKQIFFVDSLPRTTGGKIDKESIREHLAIPSPFLVMPTS